MIWAICQVNKISINIIVCGYFICHFLACDKNFDLVFVIDGSGSIEQAGKGNFQLIKNFVKDVIEGFNIGFYETHVGAIIFSESEYVKTVFGLEDHYTKEGLDRAIDSIIYPAGGTYTGKALNTTREKILTPPFDREEIPNVCIVITDGKANDNIDTPAQALRDGGTTIFAVGVGRDYAEADLEKMAGDSSRVFKADFDKLDIIINKIKESACKGKWRVVDKST